MTKANVILIQTDQQTAKTLQLYGNPVLATPTLEKIAGQGMVFDQAFCNYPACSPSRSSMMTGRYTSSLRVHANHMLLNPQEITLPKLMKDHGYQTALIGKNHAFLQGKNYYDTQGNQGHERDCLAENFDYIFEGHHIWVDGMESDEELNRSILWAKENSWSKQHHFGINPYPAHKSVTHELTDKAMDYLDKKGEEPFFMWLSYPDPHTPYQVSEPYASMYDLERIPDPIEDTLDNKPDKQKIAHYMDKNHLYDKDHFKSLRSIHYGMIRQIDDNLKRFYEKLEDKGLVEDTMIIFLSDHGDAMGDHGLLQKHNFFYDSFIHVPMIFQWPGHIVKGRSDQVVSLVDLMPTILDLCHIPHPYGIQGKSFATILKGDETSIQDFIVIESGEFGRELELKEILDEKGQLTCEASDFAWCAYKEAWQGRGKAIRTNEWKLCIYTNGQGELYDLVHDPDEIINLYGQDEYRQTQQELTLQLLLWSINSDDPLPKNQTVHTHLIGG